MFFLIQSITLAFLKHQHKAKAYWKCGNYKIFYRSCTTRCWSHTNT